MMRVRCRWPHTGKRGPPLNGLTKLRTYSSRSSSHISASGTRSQPEEPSGEPASCESRMRGRLLSSRTLGPSREPNDTEDHRHNAGDLPVACLVAPAAVIKDGHEGPIWRVTGHRSPRAARSDRGNAERPGQDRYLRDTRHLIAGSCA